MNGDLLQKFDPCIPPFKATQVTGTNTDLLATYEILPESHTNNGPNLYRFLDKWHLRKFFQPCIFNTSNDLQCFDTVACATERASTCKETGCWFVGGDDLTGALHDL